MSTKKTEKEGRDVRGARASSEREGDVTDGSRAWHERDGGTDTETELA